MVACDDDFIFEVVRAAKFVEVLEEGDEVLFASIVREVSRMDEDISLHGEGGLQGLEAAVGVRND